VLCITHLPQIASKADEHFKVYKILKNKRTSTEMTLLDDDNRIDEIARMLAGNSVTEETIAFAKGLLLKGKEKR
jgi:DNA repair protein RecN (Recombination protein N)